MKKTIREKKVMGGFIADKYEKVGGKWKKVKSEKRAGFLNRNFWYFGLGSYNRLQSQYDYKTGKKLMVSATSISPDGTEKYHYKRDYTVPLHEMPDYTEFVVKKK